MKIADIGVNQELQPNGMIAESWMRRTAIKAFWFWVAYTLLSFSSYEYHFWVYSQMVVAVPKSISEQTYITLISQLEMINWTIFAFFGFAVFAPKALQKFAEVKGLNLKS